MSARGDNGCQYRPGGFFAAVSIAMSASVSTAMSTAVAPTTVSATTMTTATTPAGGKEHRSSFS
jgi:hypothetical protein